MLFQGIRGPAARGKHPADPLQHIGILVEQRHIGRAPRNHFKQPEAAIQLLIAAHRTCIKSGPFGAVLKHLFQHTRHAFKSPVAPADIAG